MADPDPQAEPEEGGDESPKRFVNVKVRPQMKKDLETVAEAYGWPVWKVLRHLLRAELPAELGAAEARLPQIRKGHERVEELRRAFRKERGAE